ncbi:MAG: endo-polygalacturonase, partial [Planctomycetes bacterium]|nr:endo-polygalacturonase [Planctomycetota bacterium]
MRQMLYSYLSKILFVGCAMSFAAQGAEDVRIYPAPKGIELSTDFTVAIEGRQVPVYKTKVPPGDSIPRLSGSRREFGFASLASFDMRTSVDVTVTCPDAVKSIKILPTSYGIVPKVHGQTITITIDKPKHVTVEVNGDWQESLHIFANPFEQSVPEPDDPDVIYFGPGVHEVTNLSVGDNKTVYIAGGAYIRGGMDSDEKPTQVGLRTMLL